jgi:hypothetical protein
MYYSHVLSGEKTFEIRYNDRGFKVGDKVMLREVDSNREYTGRQSEYTIGYICDYEQKEGYVVFTLVK